MKHVLTFFIMLFALAGCTQDNLQFSQVKLVTSSETVPADKVWKVVGVAGTRFIEQSTSSSYDPTRTLILINGTQIDVGGVNSASHTMSASSTFRTLYANTPTTFPLWLPAGASLAVSTNVNYISVIEFNIQ